MGRSTKNYHDWHAALCQRFTEQAAKRIKMNLPALYQGGANIETAVNTLLRAIIKEEA